ncbi:MAG: DUF2141 domain-containing protein [Rhizobacter sp.]
MSLKQSLAITLATAGLAIAGAAQALTLTIVVSEARSPQGTINAALYNGESTWLKAGEATQVTKVPTTDGKTLLVFTNLAPGRYAVSMFHDENGNGQLDKNVLGMPTERYGFTGTGGSFGPPSFADASIDLQADTTLSVALR